MSTTVISFFNNKGGVGKTSLVYHLSWMFADLGVRTLAVDLDPQSNLSSAFLEEEAFESLYETHESSEPATIYEALRPLIEGYGDIRIPKLQEPADSLRLIPGDLLLSTFEDQLSETWPKCSNGDVRAFRVTSAFWRIMQGAAEKFTASVILVDLGPNLGAINRASLISSDYVVIPLAPDLFSLQGLKNLGPRLRAWRDDWKEKVRKFPGGNFTLPQGSITPTGYIVQQHAVRLDRPVKAYGRWMNRIPDEYRESVLKSALEPGLRVADDPQCLATLKNYRSLMPLAQEAHKPMFHLRAADGALGGHATAALDVYKDYKRLALQIANKCAIHVAQSEQALPTQQSLFSS
jgi:cellulose biosynthesis protein BcsQ